MGRSASHSKARLTLKNVVKNRPRRWMNSCSASSPLSYMLQMLVPGRMMASRWVMKPRYNATNRSLYRASANCAISIKHCKANVGGGRWGEGGSEDTQVHRWWALAVAHAGKDRLECAQAHGKQ